MSGFGSELLLFTALGYVILGPKRMQALLGKIAQVKAEFDRTRREISSQITTDVEGEISSWSRER